MTALETLARKYNRKLTIEYSYTFNNKTDNVYVVFDKDAKVGGLGNTIERAADKLTEVLKARKVIA